MPSLQEFRLMIFEVALYRQVKELDPGVTMKIAVKGDQTAAARRSKGGKVRVCPVSGTQVNVRAPLR